MDGLKGRAHDSSRAMDGEARFSLARIIRAHTSCGLAPTLGPTERRVPPGFAASLTRNSVPWPPFSPVDATPVHGRPAVRRPTR